MLRWKKRKKRRRKTINKEKKDKPVDYYIFLLKKIVFYPHPQPPAPAVDAVEPLDSDMGYMMFLYPVRFLLDRSLE